jgi:hypothetical protein
LLVKISLLYSKFRSQSLLTQTSQRNPEEEVARSLEGNWREDMLFELRQAVEAYDFTQKQIVECDQRLQALLADLPAREVAAASVAAEDGTRPDGKKKRSRRNNRITRICRDSI